MMKPHNDLGQSVGDPYPVRGRSFAWAHLCNAALGLWLLTSPPTFGYLGAYMAWSDLVAGVLLVAFGLLAVDPERWWARWAAFVVGMWLLFAPLVLWADSAAAYTNSTLVGILAIGFAIIAPRDLGSPELEPDLPPGWSFNPSSWVQRLPIITLAWISFLAARYLATYQLGYPLRAWDPIFGDGTRQVLESEVSEAFPISDAGLGAVAYALEALVGFMGNASRWRTAPWVVALFGVLVVPLGIVSIILIMLQPIAVGAWCALCLLTAITMLIMACLAVPEVVAMVHFLVWTRRQGGSVWHTFWHGGPMTGTSEADATTLTDPPLRIIRGMFTGATAAPALIITTLLGVATMFAPTLLGITDRAADSHYLTGALVITFSVVAMAEVARPLRWLNVPLAIWLAAAPWLLAGSSDYGVWADLAIGVLIIIFSVPLGPVRNRYGGYERLIV